IVRHLVELHGGTVEARSGGPGQGATFRVLLPKHATPAPDPVRGPGRPDAGAPDLTGLHVLLLDDDPALREILSLFLERNGARVTCASSVAEAMKAIEAERPDAVVSDISMPQEDGYDLIRQLRSIDRDGRMIPT